MKYQILQPLPSHAQPGRDEVVDGQQDEAGQRGQLGCQFVDYFLLVRDLCLTDTLGGRVRV